MYSIRVYPFLSGEIYYELYYGYSSNANVYPIFLSDSEKVSNLLFLKGIKLEDFIQTDIDMDTFNLLYPYTIQYFNKIK